jgi:integrase
MPTIPKNTRLDRLEAIEGRQTDYLDDGPNRVPGLMLRVTPTGNRHWAVKTRRPNTKNASRFMIGDLREMSLSEARGAALEFKAQVRKKVDPILEREQRAQSYAQADADRDTHTFSSLAELFLERHVQRALKPSTQRDYTRIVKNLSSLWGDRDARTISKIDVIDFIDKEQDRAPVSARMTFAVARRLFGYAIERGLIESNPCDGLRGPSTPSARDRWLTDAEISHVWAATEQIQSLFSPALRFLLATAQRLNEVSKMKWHEVDFDKAVWTIPAERAKNGRAHEVDLPPISLEILQGQLSSKNTGREYVFGTGVTPLSGWSRFKRDLDARINDPSPIPHWRIHDLRRTAASHMAGLGFAPHVIERVLNHVSGATGGLVAVYQHHDHRVERKAALTAWNAKIERLIGQNADNNVVALR